MINRRNIVGDQALGMDSSITRRDFLGTTLLASGAVLLDSVSPTQLLAQKASGGVAILPSDWNGYSGVGDYAGSNGNTWEVLTAGHKLRDGVYEEASGNAVETGETYDCVVVGGGISGLAAALFFLRQAGPNATCLVLDNHPIFGGEAKQNDFEVDGQRLTAHQGSAIYFVQYPHSFLAQFYESIGLKEPRLEYQNWGGSGPEMTIGRTPYDSAGMSTGQYGFWFGAQFGPKPGVWQIDPVGRKFAEAPVSEATRKELLRWFSEEASKAAPFASPKYEGDEVSRYLDSITLEEHYMRQYGLSRDFIRTYLSPDLGGGSGLGADALSAYADYAFEVLHPYGGEAEAVQMFPGGNTTIARLMVKALVPSAISGEATVEGVSLGKVNFSAVDSKDSRARIRLGATAISVRHENSPEKSEFVSIVYADGERLFRVRARSAVMAGGSWTTKHVIRDLPEAQRNAYAQFFRSPCMMANVALRNWRFLAKLGITGCRWFGDGIGNYMELRRMATVGDVPKTISPDSPVILTVKVLYSYPGLSTEDQGDRGRGEMITTPFRDYERRIRQQFTDMFAGAGFAADRDIAGIILNRWGHAYLSPQPRFFFGSDGKPAPREVLRAAPFGRIAFANSDLAGAMDHRFSILEAQRAVGQLMAQVISE
jgi:spermidine dehydrogenase